MANEKFSHTPTELKLHRQQKMLEVSFDDDSHFELPCEYLRVFSPSAEVRIILGRGEVVLGKEDVNIERIEPVGGYAVQLHFDDGHHTGIYSWKTLYELGEKQSKNWLQYKVTRLEMQQAKPESGLKTLNMLYFVDFATKFRRESEEIKVPEKVNTVQLLLTHLCKRGKVWQECLGKGLVKVTVNRQFANPETTIKSGDEIALVPAPK
ncbi:MAG: gamma-butyrobetaine hydroxylase-like domain-containing protein [Gammaproteobacteria bacterium]|nr:gamma-butyrobetaine hydroxylase-like domain-containing protein [Gammaproteobacteria bacterium]